MSFSLEAKAQYVSRIDAILAKSDLNTISAKRIRKELQDDFDYDLTQYKTEINDLIASRFDAFATDKGVIPPSSPPEPVVPVATTNGVSPANRNGTSHPSPHSSKAPIKRPDDSDDMSDVIDDRPPKKKPRPLPVDDDAAFAARLQAEENSRARPTRGGGQVKKRPVAKKNRTPKKKSSAKIKADDDSDLESDSQDGSKAKKKSGAFHKPQHLSPPLAELLGENVLSRPQTVKGIWDYVKKNELQNPSDKRQIMCDDALRAVFKRDSVHMFTMNKILSTLLTPVDEAV